MLWIAKVTSGVAVDGNSEFSMVVADDKSNVYEIAINEGVYDQVLGVIAESLGGDRITPPSDIPDKAEINGEVRSKLAGMLSAPPSATPEHGLGSNAEPSESELTMASVGFDLDYNASYEEEEEPDPGEDVLSEEDRYVGPL